jgi:hypothetical protein
MNVSTIGLRIEWCKAQAREARWTEEVYLLREEMRRVKVFLSGKGISGCSMHVLAHLRLRQSVRVGQAMLNDRLHCTRA